MQELPFANAEGHVFDEMVVSPTLDNGFDLLDWLSNGKIQPQMTFLMCLVTSILTLILIILANLEKPHISLKIVMNNWTSENLYLSIFYMNTRILVKHFDEVDALLHNTTSKFSF